MEPCPHPHKRKYKSRAKANKARVRMKGRRRKTHVYQCPSGDHFHIGSTRSRDPQEVLIDLFWRGTGEALTQEELLEEWMKENGKDHK